MRQVVDCLRSAVGVLVVMAALGLAGCQEPPEPELPEPVDSGASEYAQTLWPGEDVLGFGYDLWGAYASQESLKDHRLFDFGEPPTAEMGGYSYLQLVPEVVGLKHISSNDARTLEGSSRREYAERLAVSAGLSAGTFFFKGSVEGHFGKEGSESTETYFVTYMDVVRKWRVTLDTRDVKVLRGMLERRFASDLDRLPPDELFSIYGTHYVARAYLGGRADYSSKSEDKTEEERREFAAAVKFNYKSVKGRVETEESDEETRQDAKSEERLIVVGGNAEYASDIADWEQYKEWAKGIARMPVLCDFDGPGSLRPIWELAADDGRRDDLREEFERIRQLHSLPEEVEIAAPEAKKTEALTTGLYTIQHKPTLRFLDAYTSRRNDWNVVTRENQSDDSQKWRLKPQGDGVYTIQQIQTGRYLDAWTDGHGSRAVTREEQRDDSQRWRLKPQGDGVYTIQQLQTDHYLDAWIDVKDNQVVTRRKQDDGTQRWVITRME